MGKGGGCDMGKERDVRHAAVYDEPVTRVSPAGEVRPPFERLDADPLRPRRVLFFGKKKSRSCCTGALVRSLRNQGLQVKWVNCSLLKRWIGSFGMRAVARWIRKRFDPDLIFVFFHDLPHVLVPEFTEEVPTVVWIEDSFKSISSEQLDYVRSARLVCLSTPSLVWAYRSLGIENATFMMSGFSPLYHQPLEQAKGKAPEYDRDIAFIGGPGYMGNRPEFLSWLSEHHDLEIFGRKDSWQPYLRRFPNLRLVGEARPRAYAEVCARSKIVLGLNQTHDPSLYFSNRVFLTLACRGFHMMHYVPQMEQVFEHGEHLAWFRTREECLAQVGHWLSDDEARLRVAQGGYELVMSEHRYDERVAEILGILAGERGLSCPLDSVDEVLEISRDTRNGPTAILSPRRAQAEVDDEALQPLRRASGFSSQ